jgi:hypothetical protein
VGLIVAIGRRMQVALLRTQLRWCEEDARWYEALAGTEPVKAAKEAENARHNAERIRVQLILLGGLS